jgi:hypothetical protein
MALGSPQPPTEMSTRNLPGVEGGRPARKADNLTASCEPTIENVGASIFHNPMGLHGLLQGQLCLIFYLMAWKRMGEWMYSSTILGLDTVWRWLVNFTLEERALGTHCTGDWLSPRAGLTLWRRQKSLAHAASRTPTVQPAAPSHPDSPILWVIIISDVDVKCSILYTGDGFHSLFLRAIRGRWH